jgi:hypothetical protein
MAKKTFRIQMPPYCETRVFLPDAGTSVVRDHHNFSLTFISAGEKACRTFMPLPVVGIAVPSIGVNVGREHFSTSWDDCEAGLGSNYHVAQSPNRRISAPLSKATIRVLWESSPGTRVRLVSITVFFLRYSFAKAGAEPHLTAPALVPTSPLAPTCRVAIFFLSQSLVFDQREHPIDIAPPRTVSGRSLGVHEIMEAGDPAMPQASERADYGHISRAGGDTGAANIGSVPSRFSAVFKNYPARICSLSVCDTSSTPHQSVDLPNRLPKSIRPQTRHNLRCHRKSTALRVIWKPLPIARATRLAGHLAFWQRQSEKVSHRIKDFSFLNLSLVNKTGNQKEFFEVPQSAPGSDGYLLVDKSETPLAMPDSFERVSNKCRASCKDESNKQGSINPVSNGGPERRKRYRKKASLAKSRTTSKDLAEHPALIAHPPSPILISLAGRRTHTAC